MIGTDNLKKLNLYEIVYRINIGRGFDWELPMVRYVVVLLINIFLISQAVASNQEKIEWILNEKNPPFGVVFEIVEGSKSDLQWAIAEVKKYSQQLRKRFPDIGIAVVSHGSEQFGLMKSEEKNLQEVHNT
ncbi:hypothetical protein, partial [Kaarinaea lacus]